MGYGVFYFVCAILLIAFIHSFYLLYRVHIEFNRFIRDIEAKHSDLEKKRWEAITKATEDFVKIYFNRKDEIQINCSKTCKSAKKS